MCSELPARVWQCQHMYCKFDKEFRLVPVILNAEQTLTGVSVSVASSSQLYGSF